MKVAMKFGSLTSASSPGGSGNGGAAMSGGGGDVTEVVLHIESITDPSQATSTDDTIYLLQGNVWASPDVVTNQRFMSVEELPPDPDDNVLYLIRKR